jgi:hypothetical protein
MLFDDVLMAMTLGGLFLSAIYIGAEFGEARRRRNSERRRKEATFY